MDQMTNRPTMHFIQLRVRNQKDEAQKEGKKGTLKETIGEDELKPSDVTIWLLTYKSSRSKVPIEIATTEFVRY